MTRQAGRLVGRRIALGITGSIAAYKAVELLRLFQTEGADVRVLMTPSATAFIGPLTLETLSHHPVDADVLALQADGRIGHISAANDVEAIVVAPATAHWLGAMAHGLAGDSITAACLATSVPVVVAPAMDGGMYAHPGTRANVARLLEFGYRIVEPEMGPLASGMVGRGRLAALPRIIDATVEALSGVAPAPAPAPARDEPAPAATAATLAPTRVDFAGRHVVVTAGGTVEPIDPVRFVGNRSSGKMGIAVAEEALDRGAAVTLILGNVSVDPPAAAHVARIETAAELQAALRSLTPPEGPVFDVLVMAAAVADFRPRAASDRKIGRGSGMKLELDATPDLLAEAAERVRTSIRASGLRLRHGHEPRHHLRSRERAGAAATALQASGRGAAPGPHPDPPRLPGSGSESGHRRGSRANDGGGNVTQAPSPQHAARLTIASIARLYAEGERIATRWAR